MAEERQPPDMVEGAAAGDVEDEVQKIIPAEARKAAAALSKLDAAQRDDDAAPAREVDQEAVSRAMNQLGGAAKKPEEKKEVKKVKVDAADVALLVSLSLLRRERLAPPSRGPQAASRISIADRCRRWTSLT
jgi:hypothetical protein